MAVGNRDAVCEYFTAALQASAGWPEDFPRRARAEWDRADNHLLGTMLHEGATKGILVTAAEFGPSAQEFAACKPLTSSAASSSPTC